MLPAQKANFVRNKSIYGLTFRQSRWLRSCHKILPSSQENGQTSSKINWKKSHQTEKEISGHVQVLRFCFFSFLPPGVSDQGKRFGPICVSVILCICGTYVVHHFNGTELRQSRCVCLLFLSLNPSWQKDFWAMGLTNRQI